MFWVERHATQARHMVFFTNLTAQGFNLILYAGHYGNYSRRRKLGMDIPFVNIRIKFYHKPPSPKPLNAESNHMTTDF